MKIGFTGIDEIDEGKIKYDDPKVSALVDKINPKKITPYFVEFIRDEFVHVDAILVLKDKLLDVLIQDMEKLESRLSRAESESEKQVVEKCLKILEKEIPLCDASLDEKELVIINALAPVSIKPVVVAEHFTTRQDLLEKIFEKVGVVFFYTAGDKEVHSWPVKINSDIVTCAGRIHTDLAKGFIRADVVSFDDYMSSHNMNDAKQKGLVKLVDRDYIIRPGDIIEIRFNI